MFTIIPNIGIITLDCVLKENVSISITIIPTAFPLFTVRHMFL